MKTLFQKSEVLHFIQHDNDNQKMNSEVEKKIFDIHSAFLIEYSQATVALSDFYKTVSNLPFLFLFETISLNLFVSFELELSNNPLLERMHLSSY